VTHAPRSSFTAALSPPSCPVIELTAPTRREEARAVMATIRGLCDRGVGVRDIAVVARDLDPYEEPLNRAAIQYGLTPVFWTQLRVTRTEPYALIDALCTLFAGEDVTATTLVAPLIQRWAPPTASSGWPLDQSTIQSLVDTLPPGRRSIAAWDETVSTHTTDERLTTYLDWLQAHADREPTPETVRSVLETAIDAYRDTSVPDRQQSDSPALIETETRRERRFGSQRSSIKSRTNMRSGLVTGLSRSRGRLSKSCVSCWRHNVRGGVSTRTHGPSTSWKQTTCGPYPFRSSSQSASRRLTGQPRLKASSPQRYKRPSSLESVRRGLSLPEPRGEMDKTEITSRMRCEPLNKE